MKTTRFVAAIFAVVAACAAFLTVFLGFAYKDAAPVLLEKNYLAQSQAVAMMNSICRGDFDGASQRMLGQPKLGMDREPTGDVGKLLWDAYADSFSFELDGDCYITDSGLAQKVKLTCLDLNSATEGLHDATVKLLEERVENTKDRSLIYDENDQYREEFLMSAVYDSAVALLEQAQMKTVDLTLNLCHQDGQWWVVADNALLDVFSGGTSK